MRAQMRLAALLVLKRFTGVTPGRLSQIATSRSNGQALASSASSCWVLKLSNGVAVAAAAASSGLPCAVMLFSWSMVNVIVILLMFRALRGHDMDHSASTEKQGIS